MRFSRCSFSKWHALGNSYLLVERRDVGGPVAPELARRLCDVRYGVGSDGLLEIVDVDGRRGSAVIWNPDGSLAEFSGNGTRIAAMWLSERSGSDDVSIEVDGREHAARREGSLIEMSVGIVEVGEIETIELAEERVELTPVSVGNPHAVVQREPLRADLLRLGPQIETHERFPERTNVQLVRVDSRSGLTALVWEGGAGETAASGSSAVAVAGVAIANGWCESPATVRMPGGDLRVAIDGEMRALLTGPAERICEGEVVV
jgi:diaminopimelate epimerase